MSTEDRNKWNQRYAANSYHKDNPVTFLEDWLPVLPVGRALDVACGAGRNSIRLAQAGYRVDAIDISGEGLKLARQNAENHGLVINWIEHDLDVFYRFDTDYDLIIVLWYVNPGLISRLCGCLAAGGYLLCEEHLVTEQEVIGPTSPEYRVAPGTLRESAAGVDVVFYDESIRVNSEDTKFASARMVVMNSGRKQ